MPRAVIVAGIALACCAAITGCGSKRSCLEGDCPAPCEALAFQCDPQDGGPLYVGRVADAPGPYRLRFGQAADDDMLISNGITTAVISAIDHPNDLAPTGGNLIDFGPVGGVDDVTLIYQLSGILPDDAFAYRTLEFEQAADAVRVTLRGTLDGRPDVRVVTRYEMRACDRGIRVRSELFNGSADAHAFLLADASHWGKRRVVPFVPAAKQGYEQPKLDLLELTSLWTPYDFVASAPMTEDGPAYGVVACSATSVSGVNDLEVSALGTEMTLVEPGDTIVHERLLVAAGRGDGPSPAIDATLAARAQLFGVATTQVSGRVVAGGMPFGGDIRRASVMVRANGRPVSAAIPGADGRFTVTVPAEPPLTVEVWSFGRKLVETTAENGATGDLDVPLPATLQLSVQRGSGLGAIPIHALVALHPADDTTRAAVTGSFHARLGDCAPWLGPPTGSSPSCNRTLVDPQGTELEVPAGSYELYATAGPEFTLGRQTAVLAAGEITALTFALERLDVAPAGWLSADLHVHGRASFDSALPDEDRVRSFVAQGVDVIAATDHDVIGDYTTTVRALGLDDRIAVMGGLEATQVIPWLDIPGEALPRVIGHFNFWPLVQVPGATSLGAPSDEYLEPGALFDRMAPLLGPDGMMMLNHPWDEQLFGRDQGYLRAINYDPRVPITDDSTLLRRPSGGHRNIDWNLIEIINGADFTKLRPARLLWLALLAQGFVVAGAGNSDSHSLNDAQLGWARNWVDAGMTVATFDAVAFDRALRDGKLSAGNGIVVTVAVGRPPAGLRNVGLVPYRAQPGDMLEISVRAPPWVPVDEVRVTTSKGTKVIASGTQILHAQDPFGSAGIQRYHTLLVLAELVERDDFIFVEAGITPPREADLDDDGLPDTTDNNGDGRVDGDDVEDGEATGPYVVPADPTDPRDPRFAVTRVIPGAWPEGFANPILVDAGEAGWNPPGLR